MNVPPSFLTAKQATARVYHENVIDFSLEAFKFARLHKWKSFVAVCIGLIILNICIYHYIENHDKPLFQIVLPNLLK